MPTSLYNVTLCLQIFSRILRSFQLPVGPNEMRVQQVKSYLEARHSASFIVNILVRRNMQIKSFINEGKENG